MEDLIYKIQQPDFYLHRFNFQDNQASFLTMDRVAFKTSPFLDNRIKSVSSRPDNIALDTCLSSYNAISQHRPPKIIFHTAYCCSTLLSRALDINDHTLVYREPVALHQLAVMKRRRQQFPDHYPLWDRYLDFTLQMLAKTWEPTETPIIKATDSCNNIISEISAMTDNTSVILLYSKLEDFIASNLKSDGRRKFLKNFVMRSSRDAIHQPLLGSIDASALNDAQSATYVWMVQILLYIDAINLKNCRTLNAEDLLENPSKYLLHASQHFDLSLDRDDINKILKSPVWNKHAKDLGKTKFNSKDRYKEKENVINENKIEVQDAIEWAFSFADWNDYTSQIETSTL